MESASLPVGLSVEEKPMLGELKNYSKAVIMPGKDLSELVNEKFCIVSFDSKIQNRVHIMTTTNSRGQMVRVFDEMNLRWRKGKTCNLQLSSAFNIELISIISFSFSMAGSESSLCAY